MNIFWINKYKSTEWFFYTFLKLLLMVICPQETKGVRREIIPINSEFMQVFLWIFSGICEIFSVKSKFLGGISVS